MIVECGAVYFLQLKLFEFELTVAKIVAFLQYYHGFITDSPPDDSVTD